MGYNLLQKVRSKYNVKPESQKDCVCAWKIYEFYLMHVQEIVFRALMALHKLQRSSEEWLKEKSERTLNKYYRSDVLQFSLTFMVS